VIVPVHGNAPLTYTCLHSIAQHQNEATPFEVIVIDDASPDDGTAELLARAAGIRVVRNLNNDGFLVSCNRGAAIARGSLLLFLNNDTIVRRGWLDFLVARLQSSPSIGAVGAKLLSADGKISEAGAIIWNDGSGWNYGRGQSADDPAYNYCRIVDYCSAAALLVRKTAFDEVGGFDERYRPAYYEDVDLCFALRAKGLHTVFEPRSVIVHLEGATAGVDDRIGVKSYQRINQPIFSRKWANALKAHEAPDANAVEKAARRLNGSPRILVIDSLVPLTDGDAGSTRLFRIMEMLRALGCHVMFLPDGAYEPYAQQLRDRRIEVIADDRHPFKGKRLQRYFALADAAWVCRPNLGVKYFPLLQRAGVTAISYDAEEPVQADIESVLAALLRGPQKTKLER
jgi:GT2 family glycosyltransferase